MSGDGQRVTTQGTSKAIKLQILLSYMVMFSGCGLTVAGISSPDTMGALGLGLLLLVGGLVWRGILRFVRWWQHE